MKTAKVYITQTITKKYVTEIEINDDENIVDAEQRVWVDMNEQGVGTYLSKLRGNGKEQVNIKAVLTKLY